MPRRQPPGRKRRTREHVIADLGVNYVERVVLRCGYAVERMTRDYGIDLVVETFDRRNDLETGPIKIQVKATDTLAVTTDGRDVQQRVAVADLKSWLFDVSLVVLVVYDARTEAAYWLDVQEYARTAGLDIVTLTTTTLRVPVPNQWTPEAVRGLRATKNRLVERMERRYPDDG